MDTESILPADIINDIHQAISQAKQYHFVELPYNINPTKENNILSKLVTNKIL